MLLRYDLTDVARIAFMFNGGQSAASILSPICTKYHPFSHQVTAGFSEETLSEGLTCVLGCNQ